MATTTTRGPLPRRFRYDSILAASDRVRWTVDDILPPDAALDFSRPFLPESLARVEELASLDPRHRLALNHIRGHGYLVMFGLVEECILPFVLDHTRDEADPEEPVRREALLNFATEEAKHIRLFRRFEAAFRRGFGTSCETIGPAAAIAAHVLSHDRLGVALLILHVEWMTQRHYVEAVRDDGALDPRFAELLRAHWMEEAQHARLDTLMVEEIAAALSTAEIDVGIDAYLRLVDFLDDGLVQQARFDLDALRRATGWAPTTTETVEFLEGQHQAMRQTYLGSGMTHPEFVTTIERIASGRLDEIRSIAADFA